MFFEHLPGQFQGLANRTSDKQRPGPLDLTLLFKEIVRLKKISSPTSSTRDLLMKAVQEYNKSISNRNWRVKDEVKKLVYNLIRCPVDVLDLLKRTCDKYRWEQSATWLATWFAYEFLHRFYMRALTLKWLWGLRLRHFLSKHWTYSYCFLTLNWSFPCQKMAQLSSAQMCEMLEVCNLWTKIAPDLNTYLGTGESWTKIEAMWNQGSLGL